jgi:hypothetical protein
MNITDPQCEKGYNRKYGYQGDNTIANTYTANVAISGKGNDVRLNGQYHVNPNNNSTYDLDLVIGALQLHSIEGLSMNNISNASGYLSGKENSMEVYRNRT